MRLARTIGIGATIATAGLVALASQAFTAASTVAASKVGSSVTSVTASTLQPALCTANGVAPTSVRVTGAGSFTGTASADLIVRGANATGNVNMTGGGGKDCLVAGSVNNGRTITMSPTNGSGSVCIKGPGPGSYTYGAGCAVRG